MNQKLYLEVFTMSYQLYRGTTLGSYLQETLDELLQQQAITPKVAMKVLQEFDQSINKVACVLYYNFNFNQIKTFLGHVKLFLVKLNL